MNHLQAMFDGIKAVWQKERAETQMTLGEMIERLKELSPDTQIKGLGMLDSYRGYYEDLAFEPTREIKTPKQLLDECQEVMGQTLEGYKGGEFMMGVNTPLWVADCGCLGEKLVGINDDGSLELEEDNF